MSPPVGTPPPPADTAQTPATEDASWLDADRVKVLSVVLLATYVLITLGWLRQVREGVDAQGKAVGFDFLAFWSAAKLTLAGAPAAAYDAATLFARERAAVPALRVSTSWPYPPTFLLVVAPLGLLPYLASYAVFVTGTLAAYAAVVRRAFGDRAALLPFMAFSGTYVNALQGQNGFLTGALMGGGLLLLRERPWLAGVCFGLSTMKPHLGLLVPCVLVASRGFRAFGAATATAVAFLGASVALLGKGPLYAFLEALPATARAAAANELPLRKMPTFFALARLLGAPTGLASTLHAVVAVGVALVVVDLWRRDVDQDLQRASLVLGSLLLSPYLYDYDLAWLALAIAFFVRYALTAGFRRGEREAMLALSLLPFSVVFLHDALRIQLAPLVLLGAFVVVARRGRSVPPTVSAA